MTDTIARRDRLILSARMHNKTFNSRIFDAHGALTKQRLAEIEQQFQWHGAIHVVNTNLRNKQDFLKVMPEIGFSQSEQFGDGGRTSKVQQEKWAAPGLRFMDYYPPELYLLPNNEVQYQRNFPLRVIFFCTIPPQKGCGGRTFIHNAKLVELAIMSQSGGKKILEKLRRFGMMIETGFLDKHHPEKSSNYFQSWQERFQTNLPHEALQSCLTQHHAYDEAWWQDSTLMTRITLPAFIKHPIDGKSYLRFPRIALDAPSLRNGFRQFLLGNGEPLSPQDKTVLLNAYLATIEGHPWALGDFILMDNIRYGHSRESFTGEREILLGMAGNAHIDSIENLGSAPKNIRAYTVTPSAVNATAPEQASYHLPNAKMMWEEEFTTRLFDASGNLNQEKLQAISKQFEQFGVLHITNTGINTTTPGRIPEDTLDALGFGERDQFQWGGQVSGRTNLRYLTKCMRETDNYPQDKFLLPHNEILYQRFMPQKLLFFCDYPTANRQGGRTFVHDAKQVEKFIHDSGYIGQQLLSKIKQHGFMIEMGFLDENHPEKSRNYFRSWQDRFDTQSPQEALKNCQQAIHQFDTCYWKKEGEFSTLMTRIVIPGYKTDTRDGHTYLLFPRIALDGPMLHNGYRRFPLGNGEELNTQEISILLKAYWLSRQGRYYQAGDILLVDNIRFGHARESFNGQRMISAAMAGIFWTDDVTTCPNIRETANAI